MITPSLPAVLSPRLDKGPLVKGCKCYACKKHTRAYVHHLLQVGSTSQDVVRLEGHPVGK